jgi:hypothetical protein
MERPAIQNDRMDVADKPRGMKPSPSLMFDILVRTDLVNNRSPPRRVE